MKDARIARLIGEQIAEGKGVMASIGDADYWEGEIEGRSLSVLWPDSAEAHEVEIVERPDAVKVLARSAAVARAGGSMTGHEVKAAKYRVVKNGEVFHREDGTELFDKEEVREFDLSPVEESWLLRAFDDIEDANARNLIWSLGPDAWRIESAPQPQRRA